MPNYILACYAVVIIGLFIWSFRWGDNSSPRLWLLRAMMIGMWYDNSMQSLGNWAIDSSWYLPMSYPRWAMHVLILPFLSLFAVSIMRSAGVAIASNKIFINTIWVVVIISLLVGAWHDIVNLQLEVISPLGVTKYTSAASAPPYPTLLANALVIIMGAVVWRASGWSWLFIGAVFIFLVNGGSAGQPWSFLAANMAEVVFMIALLNTEKHFRQLSVPRS